jgi:glutamate N-acetyltransferase/amino-acid N-acetyltransferase
VPGFRVAAVAAGIRYHGREDLALIFADSEVSAAGVFTTNRFQAAPVLLCRDHLADGRARAIVVNAGIANACTGAQGLHAAREMARLAAEALAIDDRSVLVASTGVIGQQIPMDRVAAAIPRLVRDLRQDGWDNVARAIMTTDVYPKKATASIAIHGRPITVTGVAKGAGMIAPDMATLIALVCTDAALTSEVLEHWVRAGAGSSFNRITVDGDTSTNDTLLVLANGAAGNPTLNAVTSTESLRFGAALEAVLLDLAQQIVEDGEGATKLITVSVTGAPDPQSARAVAFTIANSPLVKTACFGEDANWGRVVAAAGRAGVALDPERVTLYFDDVCVFRNGMPVTDPGVEEQATAVFRRRSIPIRFHLGMGEGADTVYTCDFSYDYVKINAAYRS